MRRFQGTLLVILIWGIWLLVLWASIMAWLPRWVVWAVAPVILISTIPLRRFFARAPGDDLMSPWGEYRIIRSIEMHSSGWGSCCLTIELGQQSGIEGPSVTFVFDDVSDLRLRQVGAVSIHFDSLICRDRRPNTRGGPRLYVEDRHREAVVFCCSSFRQVDEQGNVVVDCPTTQCS